MAAQAPQEGNWLGELFLHHAMWLKAMRVGCQCPRKRERRIPPFIHFPGCLHSWHSLEFVSHSSPSFLSNPDKVITRLLCVICSCHPQFFFEHNLFRLPFSLCQLSSLVIYQVCASPIPIRLLLDSLELVSHNSPSLLSQP